MKFKLGLTGSIGMGKTTTAKLFAEAGCDVWNADAAVHRLYGQGGAAVEPIRDIFPKAIVDGSVSRDTLRSIISEDPNALGKIERVVHPLVAADRHTFLNASTAEIVVFDIPLLFETGADTWMNAVVVVSVEEDLQIKRVLSRGTMTKAELNVILDKQMSDSEKRKRADFVIITATLEHALSQVQDVISQVKLRMKNA